ncbi:ABC-F family ATP-binding cassette domain-containing protein [Thiomicrospira aerophila]|nr:ATP-binding cassette domain-containing protein [Thiomicrospira aerophila]
MDKSSEALMLTLEKVQLFAGTKCLLDNASMTLHPGQKMGVVGRNGVGKSSLFKTLLGNSHFDAGQMRLPSEWRLGYVDQQDDLPEVAALDFVMTGDTEYARLSTEQQACEAQLNQPNLSDRLRHDAQQRLVSLHDDLDRIQAYLVPAKAKQLLMGLGFDEADFVKPAPHFSGGWRVRLKLARALMQPADLLLLDEPTNHLDVEAVAWLEQWLASYPGALLVISHDRHFLDQVVDHILVIDQQNLTSYKGNFAAYERQRAAAIMQQQALADKQKQKMQQLKSFIARFKAKASKAKQAQSRVKALARMDEVAPLQALNPFQFNFASPEYCPDPMVQFEKINFAYPESPSQFRDVTQTLRAGDRIGLVGINGSGKSTFIKLLVGELIPESGHILRAKGLKIGYFAQHQIETLEPSHTPIQAMLRRFPDLTEQQARDFIGGFGFGQEMAGQTIECFSGGEKARLCLAFIVYEQPHLIILDEPTNHLDMDSRDALEHALQDFNGALIMVSHDQLLLAGLVDQYWWVHEQQVTLFYGDLDAYLQQRLALLKQQRQEQKQQKQDKLGAQNDASPVMQKNKKEQRQEAAALRQQQQALTRPLTKKIQQLEQQMNDLSSQLAELNQRLADPTLYEDSQSSALIADLLQQQGSVQRELDEVEMQWLACQEELEALLESIAAK